MPQTITTDADLLAYLQLLLPEASDAVIDQVLQLYPGVDTPDNPNVFHFATLGNSGPTAINQSAVATGHQQRANNIYAETTFVCPSYWPKPTAQPAKHRTNTNTPSPAPHREPICSHTAYMEWLSQARGRTSNWPSRSSSAISSSLATRQSQTASPTAPRPPTLTERILRRAGRRTRPWSRSR